MTKNNNIEKILDEAERSRQSWGDNNIRFLPRKCSDNLDDENLNDIYN